MRRVFTQVIMAVGMIIVQSEIEAIANELYSGFIKNSYISFAIKAPTIEKKMNKPPHICS